MSNLNNYYTSQIKRDQLSAMKLADVITIRKALTEKIHREIQGLRTPSSQYEEELNKVNPSDIEIIMKDIKIQLEH